MLTGRVIHYKIRCSQIFQASDAHKSSGDLKALRDNISKVKS
jgi:hypothetical protein